MIRLNTGEEGRHPQRSKEETKPSKEKTKSMVLDYLSRELITSGERAVDSLSVRLMILTMASNKLLERKYGVQIDQLYKDVTEAAQKQDSDNKIFDSGLIAEIEDLTAKILKEVN